MAIDECAVRIKTKKELYELEDICDKHNINWGTGDKHSDIFDIYDQTVIFIERYLTYGRLQYYKDEHSEKLDLLSFTEFKKKYGEKMKIKECIVKIKDNDELRELEDICFANNIGWSCGGKEHSNMNVKTTYDEFCIHISGSFNYCSLDYYKCHNGHLNFYTLSEFKKKYKTMTKPQMRIKTEQEFIDEFGDDWSIHKVQWNSRHKMDYLFGKTLDELDRYINKYDDNKLYRVTDKNGTTWKIFKNMITPVTDIKRKRKLVDLVTKKPKPVSLNSKLFKRKTIRLSTND